jgi:hypothetical protein
VNGVNIGRRFAPRPADELSSASGAYELSPGDHIALGALVLRIELDASVHGKGYRPSRTNSE